MSATLDLAAPALGTPGAFAGIRSAAQASIPSVASAPDTAGVLCEPEQRAHDLAWLRTALVLSGESAESVDALVLAHTSPGHANTLALRGLDAQLVFLHGALGGTGALARELSDTLEHFRIERAQVAGWLRSAGGARLVIDALPVLVASSDAALVALIGQGCTRAWVNGAGVVEFVERAQCYARSTPHDERAVVAQFAHGRAQTLSLRLEVRGLARYLAHRTSVLEQLLDEPFGLLVAPPGAR